jgi:hypothetical protein
MASVVCFEVRASMRTKMKEISPGMPLDPAAVEVVSDAIRSRQGLERLSRNSPVQAGRVPWA